MVAKSKPVFYTVKKIEKGQFTGHYSQILLFTDNSIILIYRPYNLIKVM